jgi:MFS family permease
MPSKQGPVIAALGITQTLAWGSTYYLPAILANAIASDLGIGTPSVFIAFSLGLLVAGILGPASGRLIDLYGGHRVLPSSNLIFAVGLIMLGSSTGTASLVASWLVIGAGMSCGLYESAFSTLARIYGENARRPITGITLIAGFASTLCWPLSAWMETRLGWSATCYIWAATHIAICLPVNLLLPRARGAAQAKPESRQAAPGRERLLIMAALSFVFASTWFCSTAMAAHLPRLLQEAGASLPAAIAAAALVGPAQVVARLLEFRFAGKLHPILPARAASLTHPIGAAAVLTIGAPAAPFFAIAHGAGNGVMTIAMGTLPLYLFGAAGYGLRQGFLTAPGRLVQAAAPFVFDLLLTRFGTAALGLTAMLGVASFLVLMTVKKRG